MNIHTAAVWKQTPTQYQTLHRQKNQRKHTSRGRLRQGSPCDVICRARAGGGGDGLPLVGGDLVVVCSKVLGKVFERLLLLYLERDEVGRGDGIGVKQPGSARIVDKFDVFPFDRRMLRSAHETGPGYGTTHDLPEKRKRRAAEAPA